MLKLCGFSASNYYSKVKLAMLEKGLAFEEVLVWPYQRDNLLEFSPLGKIPYLLTEHGALCESQVIADYIESAWPQVPLMPADPYAAAKQRELIAFMEWHLEIVARELLPAAFFGASVSDAVKERVYKTLQKNVVAMAKLFHPNPYLGGENLTLADCAAALHFPMISAITNKIYGEDMLSSLGAADYLALLAQRPHVQKVAAEGRANLAVMLSKLPELSAAKGKA